MRNEAETLHPGKEREITRVFPPQFEYPSHDTSVLASSCKTVYNNEHLELAALPKKAASFFNQAETGDCPDAEAQEIAVADVAIILHALVLNAETI